MRGEVRWGGDRRGREEGRDRREVVRERREGGRMNDFHSSTIYINTMQRREGGKVNNLTTYYRDTMCSHSTLHGDEGRDHLHDFDLSVGLPRTDMMAILNSVLE